MDTDVHRLKSKLSRDRLAPQNDAALHAGNRQLAQFRQADPCGQMYQNNVRLAGLQPIHHGCQAVATAGEFEPLGGAQDRRHSDPDEGFLRAE
jgi:hypothetical protein